MTTKTISGGIVHAMADDLKDALLADAKALVAWESLTPLARNEWICWVDNAKLIETRKKRIERTHTELAEGERRPCCWPGCLHRTDKPLSRSQQWVLDRQSKTSTRQ